MATALSEIQREARIRLVEAHLLAENDNNINAIVETFGTQAYFVLNGLRLEGKDQIQSIYEGFGFGGNGGFSELNAKAEKWHIADDSIVLELTLSGVHTKEWNGIAATNNKFEVTVAAIFSFDEEGKLESERVYFDMTLVLKQLGVM